jgi:ABC-type spermidine/putrescine transport system permease subunit I
MVLGLAISSRSPFNGLFTLFGWRFFSSGMLTLGLWMCKEAEWMILILSSAITFVLLVDFIVYAWLLKREGRDDQDNRDNFSRVLAIYLAVSAGLGLVAGIVWVIVAFPAAWTLPKAYAIGSAFVAFYSLLVSIAQWNLRSREINRQAVSANSTNP